MSTEYELWEGIMGRMGAQKAHMYDTQRQRSVYMEARRYKGEDKEAVWWRRHFDDCEFCDATDRAVRAYHGSMFELKVRNAPGREAANVLPK